MEFKEIRRGLEGVVFDTLRADNENFFEAVILTNELAKVNTSLEGVFGPPAWPSKNQLPPQVSEVTKDFGGVRAGQTLYFWSDKKDTVFAMLWPWQDGYHVTIKIIHK